MLMEKILSINNISHWYPDNQNITYNTIKEVSLDLYSGEILTITGPSGAGKTTLLNNSWIDDLISI